MPNDSPARLDEQPVAETLVPASFFPSESLAESPGYAQYLLLRGQILEVVRAPDAAPLVGDIVEALLGEDIKLPHGPVDFISKLAKFGTAVFAKKKKRILYHAVMASLMEKLFDPAQECKLTAREIRDTFHAKGFNREEVTSNQIELIYVRILEKLKAGTLRDLAYEKDLLDYFRMKIEEISYSRTNWELNGR